MRPVHITDARSHVHELVAGLLPAGWTAYPAEPASFTAPAAIITGRDPYIGAPRTFDTRTMGLRVVLSIEQASDYPARLAVLESVLAAVILGLEDAGIGVENTSEPYQLAVTGGGLLPSIDINISIPITLER